MSTRALPVPRPRERGIALVTAMLIMAVVATLSASLSVSQQVWLRQAQNISDLSKADSVARGAVRYAGVLLARDAKNNKTDDLREDWNKVFTLPVEGGFVTIRVVDAQSRFNLNNLLASNAPQPAEIGVFRNLLTSLDLDAALAEALIDWLDGDSTVQPGGAEDLDYLNQDPPYRAANQPLESMDELRRVKGFTDDVVNKLRPFVIALPGVTKRAININTASAEVLGALVGPAVSIQPILSARDTKPFTEANQLAQQLQLPKKPDAAHDVSTSFFVVAIQTNIGRSVRRVEALVERMPNGTGLARWQQQTPIQIRPNDPQT